jgi:SOS-response transcriptional repressor LexA
MSEMPEHAATHAPGLEAILARIDRRLQRQNLSARAACLRAGLSAGQIKTMRQQHRSGRQHGVSSRTIAQLAAALGTTPEWLTSGIGPEDATPAARRQSGLPLAGIIAAGIWTEAAPTEQEQQQESLVPADPRYSRNYQFAYEVRGSSVDRIARPGDFLIVVDRTAADLALRPGDIVVVTRNKNGMREMTARRLQASTPNCELQFESNDPRYAGPSLQLRSEQGAAGDIHIGGIAIGVYRPLT